MSYTPFKKIVISFGTPLIFAYLGFKFQKYIDEVLKSRETKDIRGGAKIDWVSLLAKHKNNIPFITALFGALTGSTIVFFEDQIYQYLLDATPSTLYAQVNNRYFAAIERTQAALKVREAIGLMEAFDFSPKLTAAEKMEGYKLIIQDILTLDSKRKTFFQL